LKTKLRDEEFEGVDALQARVEELFGQITPAQIRPLYEHWIERLEQMISTNGDYVERRFCPSQWSLPAVMALSFGSMVS
jgi:hypothetical protein